MPALILPPPTLIAASIEHHADLPAGAAAFIRTDLRLTRYRAAAIDLNGDGRREVIVYDQDPEACGSGGCDLFVLTPEAEDFRVVTRISVSRTPIRVLKTSSHGWRDLGVMVAGGGIIPGYESRLRFDGRTYPQNPTVPPAITIRGTVGRVILR